MGDLLDFLYEVTEKIAGLWFAGEDQFPGWCYGYKVKDNIKICIYMENYKV